LLPYRSGTSNKLFGVAGGKNLRCTNQGAVGAAAVSALTNSRFQYVNFGTPGGQFLLAVNGADAMRRYDGSAWTDATAAPAVTGFNTTLAISINAWGQRIWMVEKNSFRVWYLPLQSIGGAATSLDLSSLFRLGGSLAGMLTWTVASTNHAAIRGVRLDRGRGSDLRLATIRPAPRLGPWRAWRELAGQSAGVSGRASAQRLC
jgi:hypothetical protein